MLLLIVAIVGVRELAKVIKRFLPLAIFILLICVMAVGLKLDPRALPSPLIGKPAPHFLLKTLDTPHTLLSVNDLKDRVWLLNVWASWCVECVAEHPLLVKFLQDKVAIVGLNYKDTATDAKAWLARHGDPYYASLVDADGKVGLDWGVYGVPETFLIDKQGVVHYKKIGPLTESNINNILLPKILELQTQ